VSTLWPDADEELGRKHLTQALYTLRRDLGDEAAIAGLKELRLDPARASADVVEFADALREGALERAAALYAGPFLDGFHVPGVPAFERWMEQERDALAHDYQELLSRLAQGATARGDAAGAVGWWRRLAAHDPLHARHATGLMRALAAAGDVAGALRHAQIYETLVEQEFDLPADREVLALARELREGGGPAPRCP
jgi:DNA-binding SARP family transcriptional activator